MRLGFIAFILFSTFFNVNAQLENIFVEKYYISDSNDATNTSGGKLEEGNVTYRIYVDLQKGYKLTKLYGEPNRPIKITSTLPFYNHEDESVSTANTINKSRLLKNIVALDSWVTLGQATRTSAGSAFFGVPKVDDKDGSFIGGQNNDGGSAEIVDGLLTNNDPAMGLPLTEADGLGLNANLPTNWSTAGLIDNQTGEDNSIFASNITNILESEEFFIQNSGATGVDSEKNLVLVAQLTTKGDLSFKINIEVEDSNGIQTKYVHKDTLIQTNENYSPLLSYPALCGCTNPDFLEYSTNFACQDASKCKTPIKYGCLDSLACNFDPTANFNVNSLCCYVGYCNDYDITVICPDLPVRKQDDDNYLKIEPNPVGETLTFKHNLSITSKTFIDIYNSSIQKVATNKLTSLDQMTIDVSNLKSGYYLLVVRNSDIVVKNKFIKL